MMKRANLILMAALAAAGLTSVTGALLAPAIGRRLRFGWVIAAGPLVSVAAALAMLGSTTLPGVTARSRPTIRGRRCGAPPSGRWRGPRGASRSTTYRASCSRRPAS
jgi:hypothetical protein